VCVYTEKMKKLLLIALVLVPLPAQAQRFPYTAQAFFKECPHLARAYHDEPVGDLMIDDGCARYIEGFEFGYLQASNKPITCMADPLTLLDRAIKYYQADKVREDRPAKYLEAAINEGCENEGQGSN
jgi:hypothetical protein